MKRIFFYLFPVLFAFLSGCGEDGPTQSANNNNLLIVKGQLYDWTWGRDKFISLKESDPTGEGISLAERLISPEGSFILAVPPPPTSEMKPVKEFFHAYDSYSMRPAISDTTVKFFKGHLQITRNDLLIGGTEWVCYKGFNPETVSHLESYKANYYYFDKDIEIKGWLGHTNYSGLNYNISAKKGWNILLDKDDSSGRYVINNRNDLNGYYQYYGLVIIPDSLKWGGGVVVPN